jgi:hypothetical protein
LIHGSAVLKVNCKQEPARYIRNRRLVSKMKITYCARRGCTRKYPSYPR